MPSVKTNDAGQAAKAAVVCAEGDYVIRVVGYRFGLTKDGASQKIDLKLLNERTGGRFYETLTFSAEALPRLVAFLGCCGVGMAPDQELEFDKDQMFEGKTFVELLGLRGWAKIFVDTYNGERRNKVKFWYADKEKLPRAEAAPEAATPF